MIKKNMGTDTIPVSILIIKGIFFLEGIPLEQSALAEGVTFARSEINVFLIFLVALGILSSAGDVLFPASSESIAYFLQ